MSETTLSTRICWRSAHADVWAVCLLPDHVHIFLIPSDENGLCRTFVDLHRRYTGFVDARARSTDHLWRGATGAVAMDETHLVTGVCYVSLNPVRALCRAGPGLAVVRSPGASGGFGRQGGED